MNNEELYIKRAIYFVGKGMDIATACKYSRAIDLLGEKIFEEIDENDTQEVIKFSEMCQNYITLTYSRDNHFKD